MKIRHSNNGVSIIIVCNNQARSWPGGGSGPPEIWTVTFVSRVNTWTFRVWWNEGEMVQGLELEVGTPY